MSRNRGVRQTNDLAIFIGLLALIGAVVALSLPSAEDDEAAPPAVETR